MNVKNLGVRMDRNTGELYLTEEKPHQGIKRLANITAPVLLSLCADFAADQNTHSVGRDVKFGDDQSVRLLIYAAPEEHPDIPERSLWVYKDKQYLVEEVNSKKLIQYGDEWYPSVSYTCYPQTDLSFSRSVPEFIEKFLPVIDES